METKDSGLSARQRLRLTFRRRRKLMVLIFLLVMVGDVIGILAVSPSWESTARVVVTPGSYHDFSPFSTSTKPVSASQAPITSLDVVEMLQNRQLAADLVRRYDLDKIPPPKGFRGRVQRAADWLADLPSLILSIITRTPMKKLTPFDQAVDDFVNDREDIAQEQDTSIVNIGVWGETPQLANSLANSLAEALIEQEKTASQQQAEQGYLYGQQELARAEARLEQARQAVMKFREQEHFSDPQAEAASARDRVEQFRTKLDAAEEELVGGEARLAKLNTQLASSKETFVTAQVLATNPVVKQVRADLARQEVELAGLLERKQEAHPEVQQLRAEMEQNRAKLASEVERAVDTETVSPNPNREQLLLDSLTLEAKLKGLEAERRIQVVATEAARKEFDALAAKSAKFERLNADVTTATEVASQLRLSVEQLGALRRTDTPLSGTGVRVIERAALPNEEPPDSPMALIDLAAGLLAAVVLAVALALLVEYWKEEPSAASRAQEAGGSG